MGWFSNLFTNNTSQSSDTNTSEHPKYSAADLCAKGEKFLDSGKFVEAMECFQAAIDANKHFEKSYLLLSTVYEKQDKKDKAKSALYALLAVYPDNDSALKRIEELNKQNVDKPANTQSTSNTNVGNSECIKQKSHNQQHGTYRLLDGKPEDRFDFFIIFNDGNRLYFTNTKDGLEVVAPSGRWNGFIKPSKSLIIPDVIFYKGNKKTVISIKDFAFESCDNIQHIELPNTIERIGSSAFSNCRRLSTITLPPTIKSIGNSAFSKCYCLKDIILPNGLEKIADWTFEDCQNLKKISIPQTVKIIGWNVFRGLYFPTQLLIIMGGQPPICKEGLGRDNIVVKVPQGTLEAYMTAPYWQLYDIQEET